MSEILKAIILGIVQGLTEFLPVSSSGHLAVIEHAFQEFGGGSGFFKDDLFFDVALHFASLFAIVLFFRKRIIGLFKRANRRILLLVVIGSVPAGIAGLVFSELKIIEAVKDMHVIIGVCFLITAGLLKLSDYGREGGFELRCAGWRRSLMVGLGQALGLLPGVSRSGSTISAGMLAGLKREDAVMFSFFLAIPAILGATALQVHDLATGQVDGAHAHAGAIAAGFAASFAVSLVAIKLLVVLVRLKKFSLFAYYCLFAAAATFVIAFV